MAAHESGRRPFRWFFPIGQFVLSFSLLGFSHLAPLPWRRAVTMGVELLNLPGFLAEVPQAMLRPDRELWTPPGLDHLTWQAISASIFAMLFWWMAGRAMEALGALKIRQCKPRINLFETVVASLIMFGGAVIFCVGVFYGFFVHDARGFHLGAAGGLWALLGGLTVVARFRQRRLRKSASGSHSDAAPVAADQAG